MVTQTETSIFQVFNYEGSKMTFKTENGITFVNATEMAKGFHKQPKDWLRLKNSKDFLDALMITRQISLVTDVVVVVNGGNNPGTWMHEDAAIELARWLSPAFAIWCNDRIKELVSSGTTSLNPIQNLTSVEVARMWLKAEEDKEALKKINAEQEKRIEISSSIIKKQEPIVHYAKTVLTSEDTLTTTQIAKDLGLNATRLNRILHDLGIQFRKGSNWFLYAKYENKGYTDARTYTISQAYGMPDKVVTSTVWTQLGRAFIIDTLQKADVSMPHTQRPQFAQALSLSLFN